MSGSPSASAPSRTAPTWATAATAERKQKNPSMVRAAAESPAASPSPNVTSSAAAASSVAGGGISGMRPLLYPPQPARRVSPKKKNATASSSTLPSASRATRHRVSSSPVRSSSAVRPSPTPSDVKPRLQPHISTASTATPPPAAARSSSPWRRNNATPSSPAGSAQQQQGVVPTSSTSADGAGGGSASVSYTASTDGTPDPGGKKPKKARRGWKGWAIEIVDAEGNKYLRSPSPEPERPMDAPRRPRGRPRTRPRTGQPYPWNPEDMRASQVPTDGGSIGGDGDDYTPDGDVPQGDARANDDPTDADFLPPESVDQDAADALIVEDNVIESSTPSAEPIPRPPTVMSRWRVGVAAPLKRARPSSPVNDSPATQPSSSSAVRAPAKKPRNSTPANVTVSEPARVASKLVKGKGPRRSEPVPATGHQVDPASAPSHLSSSRGATLGNEDSSPVVEAGLLPKPKRSTMSRDATPQATRPTSSRVAAAAAAAAIAAARSPSPPPPPPLPASTSRAAPAPSPAQAAKANGTNANVSKGQRTLDQYLVEEEQQQSKTPRLGMGATYPSPPESDERHERSVNEPSEPEDATSSVRQVPTNLPDVQDEARFIIDQSRGLTAHDRNAHEDRERLDQQRSREIAEREREREEREQEREEWERAERAERERERQLERERAERKERERAERQGRERERERGGGVDVRDKKDDRRESSSRRDDRRDGRDEHIHDGHDRDGGIRESAPRDSRSSNGRHHMLAPYPPHPHHSQSYYHPPPYGYHPSGPYGYQPYGQPAPPPHGYPVHPFSQHGPYPPQMTPPMTANHMEGAPRTHSHRGGEAGGGGGEWAGYNSRLPEMMPHHAPPPPPGHSARAPPPLLSPHGAPLPLRMSPHQTLHQPLPPAPSQPPPHGRPQSRHERHDVQAPPPSDRDARDPRSTLPHDSPRDHELRPDHRQQQELRQEPREVASRPGQREQLYAENELGRTLGYTDVRPVPFPTGPPYKPPEPRPPRIDVDYPAVVLATPGNVHPPPTNRSEAPYARSYAQGLEGLDQNLEENARGFVENVKNNLRTLVQTYFVEPSASRDAFLERIGRDLTALGWQLTDSSDGALYSRGSASWNQEQNQERQKTQRQEQPIVVDDDDSEEELAR